VKKTKIILPKRERGSAVLEMAVILPLAAILLSGILTLGPYVHIGIAVRQAAYDCAVSAAQSLDPAQGYYQGLEAAQESFSAFRLNHANASFSLYGSWERSGSVACSVSYSVPTSDFPMKRVVNMPETISASVQLPVQTFKSEWR
jgi:Flp pilus assembly protein TadG